MPALPPERPGCPHAPGKRRPLPDPAAVRLCRIPDPAPPYDEEASSGGQPGRQQARGDSERPGHGASPAAGAPAGAGDGAAGAPPPGGAGAGAAVRPAVPPGWQSRFAQVLVETLAGSRPPRQMAPWTTESVRARIERLGPQLASGQRPTIRRVVTFCPTADVVEMTVVARFGPRVRALAVRLERDGPRPAVHGRLSLAPRWLCTAVEAA